MPPKKEAKEKQVKGDQAEELVLDYMREINRPYANADVSANLQNRVPKAAAVKVLAALAEKGQLTSLLGVLAPEELASLDAQIKATTSDLEEKRKTLKTLQSELAAKEILPMTEDLGKEIERVQAENEITLKALLPFRADSGAAASNPLSAEDTKKIDGEFNRWRKEWVDRRKLYNELLGMLTDGGQIDNTASFEDDQGINRDDEEAKEVEAAEFCNPAKVKKSPAAPKVTKPAGSANGNGSGGKVKRSQSTAPPSAEEGGKKKKAKKA